MRTHNPTYASYSGDGTGRDSYIILNNGGLTKEDKPNMMWPSIKMGNQNMRRVAEKPAVAFKYKSDGSGRDSYVIRNSGGLINDFHTSKADSLFASQLRTHQNVSPTRAAAALN